MSEIIKDTDTKLEFTVLDNEEKPVNLNNLSGLILKIFQKNIDIDKFSLNSQTGFRNIELTDAANGIFAVYLNADNLAASLDNKEMFFEIKTQVENSNFDNNTEEKSSGILSLGTLEKTNLKNITFS